MTASALPYQIVSRTRMETALVIAFLVPSPTAAPSGPRSVLGPQDVAAAPDRVDQLALPPLVDLVPQVADVDVDDVREGVEIQVPDVLGDHGAGEHAARVAQEVLQQRVLLRGQLDPLAA